MRVNRIFKTSRAANRGPQHACSACWGGEAAQKDAAAREAEPKVSSVPGAASRLIAFSDIGATLSHEYRRAARFCNAQQMPPQPGAPHGTGESARKSLPTR